MSEERSKHSRAGPPSDTPTFSLVVTSRGDPETLRALLRGLLPLCAEHGVQTVVVRGGRVEDALALADEHPSAHFIHSPDEQAAPGALRAAGMAAASGDVVLFGEDGDAALRERLLHLLSSHGALVPGADETSPERPRPSADPLRGPAGGEIPSSRQDLPSRDALEASECHPRAPHHPAAWTGSPRETGSSSWAPAPAG